MKNNIKKYTFNVSKFNGYRLRVEKSNLKCFQKLKYDGLEIIYYSDTYLDFDVALTLIRKLKLRQLNNDIKRNSIEDYILQLIERSKEREDDSISYNGYWSYSTGRNGTYDEESDLINKHENKNRRSYQKNLFNQKIKQYENKGRIRK